MATHKTVVEASSGRERLADPQAPVVDEGAAAAAVAAADAARQARDEAADEQAKADAKEQKKLAGSKFVVLDSAIVARTDKNDKTATRRYLRGETFEPVDGLHDVDRLVALGALGKVDGKTPLRAATVLSKAQAAARFYQEDSPALDLTSTPFEKSADDFEYLGTASAE